MALAMSVVRHLRTAPRQPGAARAAPRGASEPSPRADKPRPAALTGPAAGREVHRRFCRVWEAGALRDAVGTLPRDSATLVAAELTKCVHAAPARALQPRGARAGAARRVSLALSRAAQVRRAALSQHALAAGAADAAAHAHAACA
jgi:hypothetical protein